MYPPEKKTTAVSEFGMSAGTAYTIKLEREESNSACYELSFLA